MKLVMMGTGTFAEPAFLALLQSRHTVVGLVTQPDRPVGEARGSTRQTGAGMKPLAEQHNIPVYQPESINTPEGIAKLREWAPDLLVVAAYGQILSNDVLSTTPHGGINVHASLLPKYRGAAPIAWAIYHGEKQTGVTIIKMSVSLDAGDMLAQEAVDIGPEETAGELEARLAPLGAKLAVEVIEQIAAGTAKGVKQDKTQATKAPKLKKEDGLIDWTRYHTEVCAQIRAMQPWPTAYTFLHRSGQKPVRVLIQRAVPGRATFLGSAMGVEEQPPGTLHVVPTAPSRLFVYAGRDSQLEVLELQPAGKNRMAAAEFLRGHPIKEGDHFGPETE
ncbi:MAG TPA: methionyl-tRNA formyltransferase [Gemmataceae bacterium]|nr:methionyl-tRNA formyltransferase [Gemmataceae bacterium]